MKINKIILYIYFFNQNCKKTQIILKSRLKIQRKHFWLEDQKKSATFMKNFFNLLEKFEFILGKSDILLLLFHFF